MEHYCDILVISSSEISMGHLSCDGRCGDVAINRDNMVSRDNAPRHYLGKECTNTLHSHNHYLLRAQHLWPERGESSNIGIVTRIVE